MATAQTKRQSQQIEQDVGDEDDLYVTRTPSSARRYNQPIEHDTLDDVLQGSVIQRRRSQPAAADTARTPRSGSLGAGTHATPKSKSVASKAVTAPTRIKKDLFAFYK